MASLADLLRDKQFRSDVGNNARDFFQSASNTAASNVTAPVDGLAWLLRKAGVNVPQAPIGGSDWAQNAGLMAEPKNKNSLASILGDAAGNIAPILGYAKAPEIAGGLNQLIKNANAPDKLNAGWHGQRGAINFVAPHKSDPAKLAEIEKEMQNRGAPTLRAFWDGEKYIGLEGSHRAQAAKNLNMTPNIEEVNIKQWMQHDFQDIKEKASVARLLDYLEYGNHRGAKYINFEDLTRP